MGYTHYFIQERTATPEEWKSITKAFRTLLEHLPEYTITAGGYHSDDPLALDGCSAGPVPVVTGEEIRFNGADMTVR